MLLLVGPTADAEVRRLTLERRVDTSSCGPGVQSFRHTLLAEERDGRRRWVDLDATHWDLGTPVEYAGTEGPLIARERFRLFDGAVVLEVELLPDQGRFVARLRVESGETGGTALASYLPDVALPCRASGRLKLRPEGPDGRAPEHKVRLYRLLQRAADALFHREPRVAREALVEARELEPGSSLVRWMAARARFSEASTVSSRAERIAALGRAERLAEEAIALDPDSGEAHLWRAASAGRIASARGNLRTLFSAVGSRRGPGFLARAFERAVELRPSYAYLGDSLYGDALFSTAQLYRRLPQGRWAGMMLGARGNLDRAVELSRRALELVPGRIEYAAELGAGLLCRGARKAGSADLEEGRRVLQGALTLPVFSAEEREERHNVGRLLRAEPRRACRYASDQWGAGSDVSDGVSPVSAAP